MNKSKKGLLVVNENSIFYEIKTFFKRLFFKSENLVKEEKIEKVKIQNENNKNEIKEEKVNFIKKLISKKNKIDVNDYKNQIILELKELLVKYEQIQNSPHQLKLGIRPEDIKIEENKEFKELLYLQKLFEMGRIKEKDLSKEERIGLEKLYKQQIYDLKKSINSYKNKIISIRTKLVQSN